MSAAAVFRAPLPLYQEGLAYWEELVRECQRHAQSINSVVTAHGLEAGHLLEWRAERSKVSIVRKLYPSTEIEAAISFERWGPMIKFSVNGYQHEDLRYYPEEQEAPLARDLDGRTVAVLGEGRSYSPAEFATYLSQHFRRCFPDMALPYSSPE
jgi:hypothetical protein